MPQAARVSDMTGHGSPLAPGIGSPTVLVGFMPAWRALPASVGGAIAGVSDKMNSFMTTPVLTPANAASKIAEISAGLVESAAEAGAEGNAAAAGTASGSLATLNSTNVTLTAAWTTASGAPGGQPAANTAYTEGIKAAAATAASAVFTSVGGLADTHICPIPVPIPPHGPGMVCEASKTVVIDNLPAARANDKVMEACGGADPIAMGCPTVMIGDEKGSAGGGSAGSGASGGSAAGAEEAATDARQEKSYSGDIAPTTIASLPMVCECANGDCAEAFESAADDGTPLVDRETYGCSGPPEKAVEDVGDGEHWIEIELVDEVDDPMANEPYILKLPNGDERTGNLGEDGTLRVEGIEELGNCMLQFPERDKDVWEKWTPKA